MQGFLILSKNVYSIPLIFDEDIFGIVCVLQSQKRYYCNFCLSSFSVKNGNSKLICNNEKKTKEKLVRLLSKLTGVELVGRFTLTKM